MAGVTLRSQDSLRFPGRADLPPTAYARILLPMSNRYSLSQTDSPRTTYRVIDHSRDGEPALHPATLPSGAPHPLAGQPLSVVTSPSRSYGVQGEGRARTWSELGGYAVAVIEQVPAWAAAPRLHGPARGALRVRRHPRRAGQLPRRRPVGADLVRYPHRHPRPPAAPLAGPLRGRRRPCLIGPPRAGAPSGGAVSPPDGLAPTPRYLHLGTGAFVRLRGLHGLQPRPARHRACPPTFGGRSALRGRESISDGLKPLSPYDGPTWP